MAIGCVRGVWRVRRSLQDLCTSPIMKKFNAFFVIVIILSNSAPIGEHLNVKIAVKYLGGSVYERFIYD